MPAANPEAPEGKAPQVQENSVNGGSPSLSFNQLVSATRPKLFVSGARQNPESDEPRFEPSFDNLFGSQADVAETGQGQLPHPPNMPRFVPVLNEVISASDVDSLGAQPAAPERPSERPTEHLPAAAAGPAAQLVQEEHHSVELMEPVLEQSIAQLVMQGLGPLFEQRLSAAMSRALEDQLQGLHVRVHQALAREVHAAVKDALMQVSHQSDAPDMA